MSLFGLIKRSKPATLVPPIEPVMRELPATPEPPVVTPADVQRMLFAAIVDGDHVRLTELCHEHRETITEHLTLWKSAPDSLCANPVAAEWYARGFELLERYCATPAAA